jgi:hypothetical protein
MAFRTIQRLEQQFAGQLRFVFRQLPLERGARGTPTLFLNGRPHQAGYDEAVLGAALAAAIKET